MIETVGIGAQLSIAAGVEVGFSGQHSAQSADGVFDTALLPWASDIAKEGLYAEAIVQAVMFGELVAIVEADGFAQFLWDGAEPVSDATGGEFGLPVGRLIEDR